MVKIRYQHRLRLYYSVGERLLSNSILLNVAINLPRTLLPTATVARPLSRTAAHSSPTLTLAIVLLHVAHMLTRCIRSTTAAHFKGTLIVLATRSGVTSTTCDGVEALHLDAHACRVK